MGKIPSLRDGDFCIPDSSVICQYLEKTHPEPSLFPNDPQEFARALWFEEYADSALARTIGTKIFWPKVIAPFLLQKPVDEAKIKETVDTDLPPLFDYLESKVNTAHFVVGKNFSIADISITTQLANIYLSGYEIDSKRWPRLEGYTKEMMQRPSIKQCLEEDKKTFNLS
jgi:glutathione S-transferase